MAKVLWLLKFTTVVFVLTALAACGSKEKEVISSETQTVDARFASAKALIDYFNLNGSSDPINFKNYVDNLYAENDLQKRMIARYRVLIPVLDLSTAVRQRFNDTLIEGSRSYNTEPIQKLAQLVKNTGDRVEALYSDSAGDEGRVHFVKLNERWWISGYTLEYDPFADTDPKAMIKDEQSAALYAAVAPELILRISDDEFTTIEQFRDAFREALGVEIRKNPEDYRILFTDD